MLHSWCIICLCNRVDRPIDANARGGCPIVSSRVHTRSLLGVCALAVLAIRFQTVLLHRATRCSSCEPVGRPLTSGLSSMPHPFPPHSFRYSVAPSHSLHYSQFSFSIRHSAKVPLSFMLHRLSPYCGMIGGIKGVSRGGWVVALCSTHRESLYWMFV